MHAYCSEWHLNVNIQKTKIIEFNSQGRVGTRIFNFGRLTIENVKEYQYLGVLLAASGTFTYTIENLHMKAQKAMFHLKRSLNNTNINPSLGLNFFDHLIKPILLYGSEIWGPLYCSPNPRDTTDWCDEKSMESKHERLHLHFCKYILNVNRKATNMAVYGELGRYPLYISIWKQTVKYLEYIQCSKDDSLVKAAYEEAYKYK